MKTKSPQDRSERVFLVCMLAGGVLLVMYAVIVTIAGPVLHL